MIAPASVYINTTGIPRVRGSPHPPNSKFKGGDGYRLIGTNVSSFALPDLQGTNRMSKMEPVDCLTVEPE